MASAALVEARLVGGHVEHISRGSFRGWALVEGHREVADIYFAVGGRVVAHCRADQERPDVAAAGYRSSQVGFSGAFPVELSEGEEIAAYVVVPGATLALAIDHAQGVTVADPDELEPFAGFEGAVDYLGHDRALGWAWMPSEPDGTVSVELLANGKFIASVTADRRRPDLVLAGRGTGLYGFEIEATFPDDLDRELWMVSGDRRVRLPLPAPLSAQVGITESTGGVRGHVDHLTNHEALGWVYAESAPQLALEVQARLGDRLIGRAIADQPRQDLLAHDIGTGNYGFKLVFSEPLQPGEVPIFTALREAGEIETPRTIAAVKSVRTSSQPPNFEAFFSAHNRFTSQGPLYEEFDPTILEALAENDRPTVLAFYLPQFHRLAENDRFWGTGFTEWRQLPRAVSRFPGHYQPRIPRDLGFYNLTRVDDIRQQAELALAAGISAFAYYFYYFDGARVLERPLDTLLSSDIEMPFVLIWANENWTKTWDGSEREVLLRQSYKATDEQHLLDTFASYLSDRRYLEIGGRPLLFIYNPTSIPDTKATVQRWRDGLIERCDKDPLFYMCQTFGAVDPSEYGFDGAMEFPPHKIAAQVKARPVPDAYSKEFTGQVVSYDDFVDASLGARPVPFSLIKTAVPSWDNDSRRPGRGFILEDSAPAKYEEWLAELVRRSIKSRQEDQALVAVNAWNEWAESAYLEPDVYFGAAYLNATARAIVRGTQAAQENVSIAETSQAEIERRVSVIVPNYNHERYIEERLASIINQTRPPDEIIFLDDASTDGSLAIARSMLEESGIKHQVHVNQKNSGSVFRQWAKGLEFASHSLIWIAESDDNAADSLLANLLPAFDDSSVMLAYGRTIGVDPDGKELGDLEHYLDNVDHLAWHLSSTTPAARLFERDFAIKNIVPNASAAVFRRPQLTREELQELQSFQFAGDWYFYSKILRGGSLAYRHRARSYFRISESSASRDALQTASHAHDHEKILRVIRSEYGLSESTLNDHLAGLREHLPSAIVNEIEKRLAVVSEATSDRPLRICIASHGFAVGGGEAVPIALANALKDAGHHVTLLVVDKSDIHCEESLSHRIRSDIPIVAWDEVAADVGRFVSDYRFDILNSHNISVDSRVSRSGADVGIPYLISMHGGYENSPEYVDDQLVEFVARSVAKIAILADKNKAGLDEKGVGEGRFVKIFNALPASAHDDDSVSRAGLGIGDNDFAIGLFSRAIEEKGWQIAIDAVALLNARGSQKFVLLLGGDGPDLAAIRQRNEHVENVIFLGNVRHPGSYLSQCDVSVLPTSYAGETFPLGLLESFNAGVPVFTTALGEIPEMMRDRGSGVPGKLFDAHLEPSVLTKSIATALADCAGDKAVKERMAAAARLAAEAFSMSKLVLRYEELFQELVIAHRQLNGLTGDLVDA